MTLPEVSLYVHLPWCERKCPYCDFNSHEFTTLPEDEYVHALLVDLQNDKALLADRSLKSIFIGGGTPSLFSVEAIESLLTGICNTVDVAEGAEVTMEANPGSAEAEKFSGFRAAGVNRLSLGIQSFNDHSLSKLGRVHNATQAHAAIDHARSAGFCNFNIDLMHGLPQQTPEQAGEDLTTALSYNPSHLSWYQLTIEPNTSFYNRPPELPVEATLANIQTQGEAALSAAGLRQYEVSAYSEPGRESVHNLNYWQFGDYLGIGAGAHGKITHGDGRISRYAKTRQPKDYLSRKVGDAISKLNDIDPKELAGEFAMNALRLKSGFDIQLFRQRTGQPDAQFLSIADRLAQRGLLVIENGRVRASETGYRFLDEVIAEFFFE